MTETDLTALLNRYDDAITRLYALMQDVDKRDHRFTVAMRQYGLIQATQVLIETGSEVVTTLGRELQEAKKPA